MFKSKGRLGPGKMVAIDLHTGHAGPFWNCWGLGKSTISGDELGELFALESLYVG